MGLMKSQIYRHPDGRAMLCYDLAEEKLWINCNFYEKHFIQECIDNYGHDYIKIEGEPYLDYRSCRRHNSLAKFVLVFIEKTVKAKFPNWLEWVGGGEDVDVRIHQSP